VTESILVQTIEQSYEMMLRVRGDLVVQV